MLGRILLIWLFAASAAMAQSYPSPTYNTMTITSKNGLIVGNGSSPISAIAPGTGVATALGNPINGAGGFVGYSGALGTPTSGVLTNATGLPILTGVSGLGTGVASAMTQALGGSGTGLAGLATANTFSQQQTLTSLSMPSVSASANNFSPSYQPFWLVGTYTGSGSGPFAEVSVTDTASNATAGSALVGWRVDHTFGGTGIGAGNRTALQAILTQNGATPGTNGNLKFYTSIFGQTYVNSNDGGSSGTPYGDYYGLGGLAQINSAAGSSSYFNQIIGAELDVSVQSPTHVQYKSILGLISVNNDAVSGSVFDAMLVFTRDNTTSATFNYGVSFGRPDSTWPISSTGTIIGSASVGFGTKSAAYGIDFSSVTFSTAAFKSTGFYVDGSGNIYSNNINGGSIETTGSSSGFILDPRSGSGQLYQFYNPSGTGVSLYNGSRNIATFDNSNNGSLSIVGPFSATTLQATAMPSSAGSGGLYVCVDTSGNTYKKASCP